MPIKGYIVFHRAWKSRKPIWWLFLCELPLVVACLVFFGIAQPDVFRTLMWRIGFYEQQNSNPNVILYAMSNHRPPPKIPFVWSQSLTDFNVAISVISLFVLMAKLVAYIMRVFTPIVAVLLNLSMTALFATSIAGQAGADYLDPRYPSPSPWYLRKGCQIAAKYGEYKTCQIIQGTFAATCLFLFVYSIHLVWAIYNMFGDGLPKRSDDDEETPNSRESSPSRDDKTWEMQPQTPRGVPFTPRTQAFHTLDRKLPFRQQQYN